MAKIATVEMMFPELKGGQCYQSGIGHGEDWPWAVYQALRVIDRKLDRKKFTTMRGTIIVVAPQKEEPDGAKDR